MFGVTAPSPRTRLKRLPERGHYDRATIDAILDAGLICHLGFVHEGSPVVIPTLYGRVGDGLYMHGSAASRAVRSVATGVPVCVTVTLVDGLVLARSAFHHSMNYRSVVIFGTATAVTDAREKLDALRAISDHVLPGRWSEVRGPNAKELRATVVLRVPIGEASAKIRAGGPIDDDDDYALDVWAGVQPLELTAGAPQPDSRLRAGTRVPAYLDRYVPGRAGR